MFLKLFILFAIIPVIEIAILIKIGSVIGGWNTVMIVIATAVIGAYLVKLEGVSIMSRFQRNLAEGKFPADEIFDGALVLVAGAVLLTPGIMTDLLGFILVFPPTRRPIKTALRKFVEKRMVTVSQHGGPGGKGGMSVGGFGGMGGAPWPGGGQSGRGKPDVVEAEVVEEKKKPKIKPDDKDEDVIDAEWH